MNSKDTIPMSGARKLGESLVARYVLSSFFPNLFKCAFLAQDGYPDSFEHTRFKRYCVNHRRLLQSRLLELERLVR